jgi:hypothetical protein
MHLLRLCVSIGSLLYFYLWAHCRKKSDPYRKNLSQCISQLKSLIDQISIQQEDIVGLEGTDTLHLHFPLYSRIDVTTQSRHISEIVPIKKIPETNLLIYIVL